jgi:hypothetical protein
MRDKYLLDYWINSLENALVIVHSYVIEIDVMKIK